MADHSSNNTTEDYTMTEVEIEAIQKLSETLVKNGKMMEDIRISLEGIKRNLIEMNSAYLCQPKSDCSSNSQLEVGCDEIHLVTNNKPMEIEVADVSDSNDQVHFDDSTMSSKVSSGCEIDAAEDSDSVDQVSSDLLLSATSFSVDTMVDFKRCVMNDVVASSLLQHVSKLQLKNDLENMGLELCMLMVNNLNDLRTQTVRRNVSEGLISELPPAKPPDLRQPSWDSRFQAHVQWHFLFKLLGVGCGISYKTKMEVMVLCVNSVEKMEAMVLCVNREIWALTFTTYYGLLFRHYTMNLLHAWLVKIQWGRRALARAFDELKIAREPMTIMIFSFELKRVTSMGTSNFSQLSFMLSQFPWVSMFIFVVLGGPWQVIIGVTPCFTQSDFLIFPNMMNQVLQVPVKKYSQFKLLKIVFEVMNSQGGNCVTVTHMSGYDTLDFAAKGCYTLLVLKTCGKLTTNWRSANTRMGDCFAELGDCYVVGGTYVQSIMVGHKVLPLMGLYISNMDTEIKLTLHQHLLEFFLHERVVVERRMSLFLLFSLPRPPEIVNLEDKVVSKQGGMLRIKE